MHPEWLKLLAESPIVDFSREHISAVTDVTRCSWLHLAQYMMKAFIPLWFSWGKVPYYVQPLQPWISDYYPDLENFTMVAPVNASLFPPVHPSSGQRHGETMEQFFARRHASNAKQKKKETPRERDIRNAHERAQVSKPYPGKKGPSVFYWDDVDGFRVRTPIPRNQVERLWHTRWKPTKKIYNAIDNSWDCCSLFGDNTLPGEPDPSDSELDIELPQVAKHLDGVDPAPVCQMGVDGEPPNSPLSSTSNNRTSSAVCPLPSHPESLTSNHPTSAPAHPTSLSTVQPGNINHEMRHDPPSTSSSQQPQLLKVDITGQSTVDRHAMPVETENESLMETENLFEASSQDVLAATAFQRVSFTSSHAPTVEDLIYYRFGFSLNEHPYSGLPDSISPVLFRSWEDVISSVGGQNLDSSGKNQPAIIDFLGCLLSSNTPLLNVPGKFWDLSPDGADPLMQCPTKFLRIEKHQFNDETRYLLRPVNLHPTWDMSWVIAVNALTALECIRRGLGPHALDTAKYLVEHGIPFLTLDHLPPISKISRPPSPLPTCLLGCRPKGYKFNLGDYAAYVTLCDSYLNSQPHACAALRVGGIVARLAREGLPDLAGISGPLQAALDGKQLVLTSDGEHFCDDQVSESILDLICGVYQVETGNKGEILNLFTWHPVDGPFTLRSSCICLMVSKAQHMAQLWTQCRYLDPSM